MGLRLPERSRFSTVDQMTESAHRFRPVHQLLAGLIALALFAP